MFDSIIKRSAGFSLVELSMVILIIGFLSAGISVGTAMVKQSRLNGVIVDMRNIASAYRTFVLTYNAVPGDMPNATSYWNGNLCAVTPAKCNGNGDRMINSETESLAAMRHLALSGTLDLGLEPFLDTYDGTRRPILGSDVPRARLKDKGYMLFVGQTNLIVPPTSSSYLDTLWDDGSNAVFIGSMPEAWGGILQFGGVTGSDAFNIDEKIDDGHIAYINTGSGDTPYYYGGASGKVRAYQQDSTRIGMLAYDCMVAPASPVNEYSYKVGTVYSSCGLGLLIK